ncbi:MAG: LacI family DNA-binding transcriptional regulator [Cyclobacteriaceae bacterium]
MSIIKKGSVTIKDIAQELNISTSTVSRALADNPLVKPATKAAVKELAKKYHYQPNFTALSLRSNKTNTIGIIIPQIVHEFFALVIRGIEDYAYSQGYNVIICSSHESYEREVLDAKALLSGRVDGLLACISRDTNDLAHFIEFKERGIPIVFFDRTSDISETSKVEIDDYNAAYQAVKHLIDIGRKSIAYVGGSKNLNINKDRLAGYSKALSEAGLKTQKDWIVHCEAEDFESGKESTTDLIKKNEIDGLFASTDMLAVGAIKNMKAQGLQIPKDIAVVGFSNWSISSLYEPSISTVDQPGYEMGLKASEILIRHINNPDEKNESVILQTELIIRESSTLV